MTLKNLYPETKILSTVNLNANERSIVKTIFQDRMIFFVMTLKQNV